MDDPQIKDIPQFKKIREDAKNMQSLKKVLPVLGPLLNLMGADVNGMKEVLQKTDELQRQAEELTSVPDKFNDLFSVRGWIMYDYMDLEVAKTAIKIADNGDLDQAEQQLVDYYTDEVVERKLLGMRGVTAFRPRVRLAELAFIDYREQRYHACVPVVLALLDGLVNDLHEKRRGFFAEEVDLKAWDSIAAHDKGLNALAKIFQKGRYKTNTEQISVPYRNGIFHGMDLGYDNKTVAAKTWAALFATRDWAARAEQDLLSPQPEAEKNLGAKYFNSTKTTNARKN